MKHTLDDYRMIVGNSRALSQEQKQELLSNAEVLPQEYRTRVLTLLRTFDEHSIYRENELRKRLNDAYTQLEQRLADENVPSEAKEQVLLKAMQQMSGLFPKQVAMT